jgi:hypothetical protein
VDSTPEGALASAVCSVTPTRRRRFFWAAWWSGPPAVAPFRKPDASNGGASSPEEALAEAERVAGRALSLVPAVWARAWTRVLQGGAPFTEREKRALAELASEPRGRPERPASAASVLGVSPAATPIELLRAYRKRALETHPDRGGEASAFRAVQAAYEKLSARAKRPRPRR